jgi:hypothetical protein
LKPWQNKEWCIPAKENAEFVCAMEDVLAVYKRSYDETHPLVCMDESSKQHINPYLTHTINIHLKTICYVMKNLRVALRLEK